MVTAILEGLAQLLVLVLGVGVTLYPPKTKKQTHSVLLAFALIGVLQLGLGVYRAMKDDEASAALARGVDDTRESVARVQEQTSQPPNVTVTMPAVPQPVLQGDRRKARISVETDIINKNDATHTIEIKLLLQNYGDLPTTAGIRMLAFWDGTSFHDSSWDNVEFLPMQERPVSWVSTDGPEKYKEIVDGAHRMEIEIAVEYRARASLRCQYVTRMRFHAITQRMELLKSQTSPSECLG